MEQYTQLAKFATTAGFLFFMAIFVVVVIFTFRKGSGKIHHDAATLPFRNDDKPLTTKGGQNE